MKRCAISAALLLVCLSGCGPEPPQTQERPTIQAVWYFIGSKILSDDDERAIDKNRSCDGGSVTSGGSGIYIAIFNKDSNDLENSQITINPIDQKNHDLQSSVCRNLTIKSGHVFIFKPALEECVVPFSIQVADNKGKEIARILVSAGFPSLPPIAWLKKCRL